MTAETRVPALLKLAILTGVQSAVRLYLDAGGDVNATDGKGQSLLILAASKGHSGICRLLLDAGADPSLTGNDRRDVFAVTQACGYPEILDMLRRGRPTAEEPDSEHRLTAASAPTATFLSQIERDREDGPFSMGDDLSAWEDDKASPPPVSDFEVHASAGMLQRGISEHI